MTQKATCLGKDGKIAGNVREPSGAAITDQTADEEGYGSTICLPRRTGECPPEKRRPVIDWGKGWPTSQIDEVPINADGLLGGPSGEREKEESFRKGNVDYLF